MKFRPDVLRWIGCGVLVLAVGWTGFRFGVLRTAANEILVRVQELQTEQTRLIGTLRAYEAGFLHRPAYAFAPQFMEASEWVSETTSIELNWELPTDGIFLVVDRECPWSEGAVEAALALSETSPKREIFLLDADPRNGPRWRRTFGAEVSKMPRVLTPHAGWWSVGTPRDVTPVWFVVEGGEFTGVGVGANGLRTLSSFEFDPAAPIVTSISFAEELTPAAEELTPNER